MIDQKTLSIYLNNHLAGSSAGLELFRRTAKGFAGRDQGPELARLADEIEVDQRSLRRIMDRLGVGENRALVGLGWIGEKVGRLKPNGYVVRRSPLADVLELEALRAAVSAKRHGWQVIRAAAVHDDRIDKAELESLIERADSQLERLYKMHLQVTEDQLSRSEKLG